MWVAMSTGGGGSSFSCVAAAVDGDGFAGGGAAGLTFERSRWESLVMRDWSSEGYEEGICCR